MEVHSRKIQEAVLFHNSQQGISKKITFHGIFSPNAKFFENVLKRKLLVFDLCKQHKQWMMEGKEPQA